MLRWISIFGGLFIGIWRNGSHIRRQNLCSPIFCDHCTEHGSRVKPLRYAPTAGRRAEKRAGLTHLAPVFSHKEKMGRNGLVLGRLRGRAFVF